VAFLDGDALACFWADEDEQIIEVGASAADGVGVNGYPEVGVVDGLDKAAEAALGDASLVYDDLGALVVDLEDGGVGGVLPEVGDGVLAAVEIGRASCRERVSVTV
jgi:hypothetical protein